MSLKIFFYPAIASMIFICFLWYLSRRLSKVTVDNKTRTTELYQGGEILRPKNQRYRSESYAFNLYFLIMHIIGFFIATMYVIPKYDYDTINWTTLGFLAIIFYTSIIIKFQKFDQTIELTPEVDIN